MNKAVDKAKEEYFTQKIAGTAGDQKELFRVSKSLLGETRERVLPDVPPNVLCEKFNNFFYDKIVKIRDNIKSNSGTLCRSIRYNLEPGFTGIPLTEFKELSVEEVKKLIKSSATKSCELDPIPTWLLKDCLDDVATWITRITNTSLTSGIFHDSFKKGIVRPLLQKPGSDKNTLQNYRPVCNLPFVSKIIEKAVAVQLEDHLAKNNLTDPLQSAYRKRHSTETALLKVHQDIAKAMDEGESVVLIMLDLSAAFDTIDHKILLRRLKNHYGLSGTVLEWIASYLSDRRQVVSIEGCESTEIVLDFSVPQGSGLGPRYYCLYAKPVTAIMRYYSMKYHGYADDNQLYLMFRQANDVPKITNTIQACVTDINTWMCQNKLKLNEGKTEIICFSAKKAIRNLLSNTPFTFGGEEIRPVEKVKDLGFYLDSKLSLKDQVSYTIKNCNFQLRNISRNRRYLTTETCKTLVHSLVTSRLDYCNSLLVGLPHKTIIPLEKLQNRAARLIAKLDKFAHTTPLFKEYHWLPIKERIDYKVLVMVFKVRTGLAPSYLDGLLETYQSHRSGMRKSSRPELVNPVPKTDTYGPRPFSVAGPLLWNSIPDTLKNSPSISVFKKRLKTYLFNMVFN